MNYVFKLCRCYTTPCLLLKFTYSIIAFFFFSFFEELIIGKLNVAQSDYAAQDSVDKVM